MLVPLGVMVPGVWDEGKQEGWGKAKESRSPYALWSLSFLRSLLSPFISGFAQTQWDMLILDRLYSICASSSPFCLSASLLALIVHCRLSEVTLKLSGWWFGDGVTAWLFAFVFVWISVSFDDLSSQSKVCLVRILFAVLFVDMDFSICFSHSLVFSLFNLSGCWTGSLQVSTLLHRFACTAQGHVSPPVFPSLTTAQKHATDWNDKSSKNSH